MTHPVSTRSPQRTQELPTNQQFCISAISSVAFFLYTGLVTFSAIRFWKSASHQVAPVSKSPNSASKSHKGLYSQYPLGACASALCNFSEGPAYAPYLCTISATTDVPLRSTPSTIIGELSASTIQMSPSVYSKFLQLLT